MTVIHFTHNAADALTAFDAAGASFLPLADGEGDTHLSCLHLEKIGANLPKKATPHARTDHSRQVRAHVGASVCRMTKGD